MQKLHERIKPASGFLQILRKSPEGKIELVHTVQNLITFDATNLFARSIAGQQSSYVNRISIQYYHDAADPPGQADNVSPGLLPVRTDRYADLVSEVGGNPYIDVLDLPILSYTFSGIPTTDDPLADTIQTANAITFHAAVDDDSGGDLNNLFVIGAGLVGISAGVDVLVAHQYVPMIEKLPFYQLLINWTIRFS
jgi:hypothetical protein